MKTYMFIWEGTKKKYDFDFDFSLDFLTISQLLYIEC